MLKNEVDKVIDNNYHYHKGGKNEQTQVQKKIW